MDYGSVNAGVYLDDCVAPLFRPNECIINRRAIAYAEHLKETTIDPRAYKLSRDTKICTEGAISYYDIG